MSNFTGRWFTTFGSMELTQKGKKVKGSYGRAGTITGTVTKVDWTNPHIVIYLDAKGANSDIEHWTLEFSAPLLMTRSGWTKSSVKVGDQLVAETHPAKDGAPVGKILAGEHRVEDDA